MKPFKFNLEPVLSLREREKQAALEAFALALEAARQEAEKLAGLERFRERLLLDIAEARAITARAELQAGFQHEVVDCERRLSRQRETLRLAEEDRQKKLEIFREANREAEVLLKLRTKRSNAHLEDERKKEEAAIEEIVMAGHAFR